MSITLSGTVRTWHGYPMAGATVSCSGKTSQVTGASGAFSFSGISTPFTGSLGVSKSGVTFAPSSIGFFIRMQDASGQDFRAAFAGEVARYISLPANATPTSHPANFAELRYLRTYVRFWVSYNGNYYYRQRSFIEQEFEAEGMTKATADAIAAANVGSAPDPQQSAAGTYNSAATVRQNAAGYYKVAWKRWTLSAWADNGGTTIAFTAPGWSSELYTLWGPIPT